jgi:hypothetical protein
MIDERAISDLPWVAVYLNFLIALLLLWAS